MNLKYGTNFAILLLFAGLLIACSNSTPPNKTQQVAVGGIHTASLSNDARYALFASVDQPAGLWDVTKRGIRYHWRHSDKNGKAEDNVIATAFSGDQRYAVTATRNQIILWDINTGEWQSQWHIPLPVHAIELDQSGQLALMAVGGKQAELFDLENGRVLRYFEHKAMVNSVAISSDGRFAATASDDHHAKIWNIQTGKIIYDWKLKKRVKQIAFSPRSTHVLTTESQGDVNLWDVATGHLTRQFAPYPMSISAAAFSDNGKLLALASLPQTITLWEVDSGNEIKRWYISKDSAWKPTSKIVYALSFTPNRELFALDSSGDLLSWRF